jgi:hypothetical protein
MPGLSSSPTNMDGFHLLIVLRTSAKVAGNKDEFSKGRASFVKEGNSEEVVTYIDLKWLVKLQRICMLAPSVCHQINSKEI